MIEGGFVDLRVHGRQGGGSHSDDSVWPSFTDIMAVVVMIFLMALVVILIRNVELVRELTDTIEAERQATQQAQSQSTQRAALERRLDQMENQVANIRLQLLSTEQDRDRARRELSVSAGQLKVLQSDLIALDAVRSRLLAERTRLMEENRSLGANYAGATQSLSALEREKQGLVEEIAALRSKQANLEALNAEREAQNRRLAEEVQRQQADVVQQREVVQRQSSEFDLLRTVYETLQSEKLTLEERIDAMEGDLTVLQQQYDEQGRELDTVTVEYTALEAKYLRLVGLARSPIDRVVVGVRYFKDAGGAYIVQLGEPNARGGAPSTYRRVTRARLEERLKVLDARYPDNLYVRVILPENNGLTHSEALEFTQQLHGKYDYYYRKK